jgi:transposase
MTVLDVSRLLSLSWSTVKAIDKRRLVKEKPTKARLKKIRYLGIDEVAIRKGHRYLTIGVDLETGDVVHVGQGRREESLLPFLKRLKRLRVNILAVATDMWPAYLRAIRHCYPEVGVIFDRYHLMARYSRLLDALRAEEYRKAGKAHKQVFKGVRYLLLKGQEKLTGTMIERLQSLLDLNRPLSIAYILKEELREFWNCADEQQGREHLLRWIQMARESGLRMLRQFARSIERHFQGLLAYFKHPISTARVEGINNKIKVLKRKAYGYRDMEYMELKIYSANKLRYSILG